jgi:hypothetical protein
LLDGLYVRILGRPPRHDEIEPSLELVHAALLHSAESEPAASKSAAEARSRVLAWAILSQALFCSTKFQYLD